MASPALALLRNIEISCGDEIWIATALLTKERPDDPDYSVEDIMARAVQENIHGSVRKGLEGYARVHCCANKAPSPSALKMLYATAATAAGCIVRAMKATPAAPGAASQ